MPWCQLTLLILDATQEELSQIVQENDRASSNAVAAASSKSEESSSTKLRLSAGGSTRSHRSWHKCQQPPSRPGAFSVGGQPFRGGTYDIGTTDELQLETKRNEALAQVQEEVTEHCKSGKYEETEQQYIDEIKMLTTTGFDMKEKRIEPVVNGLRAHIMSEQACEEALGCIERLSKIPVNKELLEDHGAVDLIYACK